MDDAIRPAGKEIPLVRGQCGDVHSGCCSCVPLDRFATVDSKQHSASTTCPQNESAVWREAGALRTKRAKILTDAFSCVQIVEIRRVTFVAPQHKAAVVCSRKRSARSFYLCHARTR